MSARIPFVLALLTACLSVIPATAAPPPPALGGPRESAGDIPFDDPAHGHFFRYQAYLIGIGLTGETAQSWAARPAAERARKVREGEDFLRNKFAALMAGAYLSEADANLLEAVWGPGLAMAIDRVAKARRNSDPEQIRLAVENVNELSRKLGNLDIDWTAVFDGRDPRDPVDPFIKDAGKNFLAPAERSGFLESLEAPEVAQVLSSQKRFAVFLRENDVVPAAMPGMLAMYSVLSRAGGEESKELGHLLPTVVRFLKDGKKIVIEDMQGVQGFAVPGDYDRPERVGITPAVEQTDPLIVGKTLAHEFQHIYDMYTGRYYTLDSELRGFKTAALYFRSLRKTTPEKYQELLHSDSDETRQITQWTADYEKALDEGPVPFSRYVSLYYNEWNEGVFFGRAPLREAVDPIFGAPRELAAVRAARERLKAEIAALEKRQEEIRAKRNVKPSRELDKELEKVAKDLAYARIRHNRLDADATLKEIRIRRMQSEVDWLDKRGQASGRPPEPFDLQLPVDKGYLVP